VDSGAEGVDLKGKNIICFANDWESDPTSKHQVMKLLSRNNRIIWINSIGMRNPKLSGADLKRITRKIKLWRKGLVRINNNLHHFTPIVIPLPSSPVARAINKYILKAFINHYRKKLGMQSIQIWTFLPNVVEILDQISADHIVYYCVDEWSQFSFMNGPAMRKMESDLLKKVDIVFTSSEKLFQDKIRYNPRTHLITHGVDYEYFAKTLSSDVQVADELSKYRKPIIGFVGLIHEWLDYELIEKVSKLRPEWSFVFIGKVCINIDHIKKCPNVHFLGQKPYEKLLPFLKGFDISIIPFVINELTLNVNPIKLREYLAAGIPVVSTPLPEVKKYSDLVRIAKTPDEMINAIERELQRDDKNVRHERSMRMKMESWDHKLSQISSLIENKPENDCHSF
jgi:glycosyltransferase involved in cell wall biosynthesis